MERLATGVPGLDTILNGGIPAGSLVLVGGPPGAGKTILATQIAFHRASLGKRVIMLTALSEANAKLIAHLGSLEYFNHDAIGSELQILNIQRLVMTEGLDATLAEIRSAVIEQKVEVLIIDSFRSLYTLTGDQAAVHNFVFGLGSALFMVGCTTFLVEDQYRLDSTSPEQAISDTILMMQVSRSGRQTLRHIEVIKMRGGAPLGGRHSFELTNAGVAVYPRIESLPVQPEPPSTETRLDWGVTGLEELTGGGVVERSTTLLLGTPGVGKTLFGLQFASRGASQGEPGLFLSFYESQADLLERGRMFGLGLREAVDAGTLRLLHVPPEHADPDKVLYTIRQEIDTRGVRRLVLDGFESLEVELAAEGRFADALTALVHFLRAKGVTGLITRGMPQLLGQDLDITDAGYLSWSPVDNLLVMRSVDMGGVLNRIMAVLKVRMSDHEHDFHRFFIRSNGIEMDGPVKGLEGLLTGLPRRVDD